MRRVSALAISFLLLCACSSPRTIVRMTNAGTQSVHEVELDYGHMFGIGELRPGESRERNVKFSDAAELSLRFYDAANQLHTSKGPRVEAKSAGTVEVRIGDGGKGEWTVSGRPE